MANAALGNDVIGESPHLGALAPQHRDLKAALAIDVYVKCSLRQIVMLMKFLRQALRQFARGMVKNIADGRDAVTAF